MKKIQHYIEWIFLNIVLWTVGNLPYNWSLGLGAAITRFLWVIGMRKDVARKNFEIAFGEEITPQKRDKILRSSYINFGRSMVEFSLISRLRPDCLRRLVNMDEAQDIMELSEQEKGAILVTGHLGSWELLGAALVAWGVKLSFLVGKQRNDKVDQLMNETRRSMHIGIINMGVAARGVLKALKSGRMVAMLSDQDGGRAGVETELFGHKVLTPGGPAAFALKAKVPIILGIIVRNPDGHTHRLITEELEFPPLTGDTKEDIQRVTQAYTDRLAAMIKEHPQMWFWPHRRFKHSVKY